MVQIEIKEYQDTCRIYGDEVELAINNAAYMIRFVSISMYNRISEEFFGDNNRNNCDGLESIINDGEIVGSIKTGEALGWRKSL